MQNVIINDKTIKSREISEEKNILLGSAYINDSTRKLTCQGTIREINCTTCKLIPRLRPRGNSRQTSPPLTNNLPSPSINIHLSPWIPPKSYRLFYPYRFALTTEPNTKYETLNNLRPANPLNPAQRRPLNSKGKKNIEYRLDFYFSFPFSSFFLSLSLSLCLFVFSREISNRELSQGRRINLVLPPRTAPHYFFFLSLSLSNRQWLCNEG